MKSDNPVLQETNKQIIELVADQQLVVEKVHDDNILNIVGSNGLVTLSIQVTPEGPLLRIEGSSLAIQATGNLAIDAKHVVIQGREGMALATGGDVHIKADGDFHSTARVQKITAELGDVDVKANDDVKLDGERIRLNC
jgi:hypothetical protein